MLEQDAPQQQTDSAQADAAKAGDPTAAAPAPAAGAAKSDNPANVLEDKGEAQVVAPADWPEDWREKLSAGDEKLLGQLKRFASPINVATSWRDAHKKLSSGEHKRWSLPDGADDEAIASWRTERGIPAEAAGYLTNLPDGLVMAKQTSRRSSSSQMFSWPTMSRKQQERRSLRHTSRPNRKLRTSVGISTKRNAEGPSTNCGPSWAASTKASLIRSLGCLIQHHPTSKLPSWMHVGRMAASCSIGLMSCGGLPISRES